MLDLALLPSGSRVFVDTNIFYLHYQGRSVTCTAFVDRIARGEVTAYVNTQVLSDLLHKLMLAEAFTKTYIARANASKLKEWLGTNRALACTLKDCQEQLENTLSIGVRVLTINRKILVESKAERSTYGLMTGDSLHLSSMIRHSVPLQHLVTHDRDFGHITDLTVWKPMDVVWSGREATT